MKTFEVNALGLEELSVQEIEVTDGGNPYLLGAITVIGAAIYIYNNWDDFKEGVRLGWEQTRK